MTLSVNVTYCIDDTVTGVVTPTSTVCGHHGKGVVTPTSKVCGHHCKGVVTPVYSMRSSLTVMLQLHLRL